MDKTSGARDPTASIPVAGSRRLEAPRSWVPADVDFADESAWDQNRRGRLIDTSGEDFWNYKLASFGTLPPTGVDKTSGTHRLADT
ncbi:hypothetical protein MTO96_032166 [Rhipicephalus appendiculatus]